MSRTITVKGIGKADVKPDYVIFSLRIETKDMDYEKAVKDAEDKKLKLVNEITAAGFERTCLKTADFNVRADYNNVCDEFGRYTRKFEGYSVSHNINLEFDFDMEKLTKVLSSISKCESNPELNIRFTVKDASKVSSELLKSAAENARRKAEILCASSNVKLGGLVRIEYGRPDINYFSDTDYDIEPGCFNASPMMTRAAEILPEDIKASDSAVFVWEIT